MKLSSPGSTARICLLGSCSDSKDLDEGMKNVLYHLQTRLSVRHKMLVLDPRNFFHLGFWRSILEFKPEIIHYLAGPSLFSLIALFMIRAILGQGITIASAIHPLLNQFGQAFVRWFKPDLVIAYSKRTASVFLRCGCKVVHSDLGVDLARFRPVDAATKVRLRSQLGLPVEKYLILHVGHICQGRGLEALLALQGGDQQVLIIGSPATRVDRDLHRQLVQAGCLVRCGYVPRIEDIYACADCYVFPTLEPDHAIQVPLSVFEAMACNLPVFTTPFGALEDLSADQAGFYPVQDISSLPMVLSSARRTEAPSMTRKLVEGSDWDTIVERLEQIYSAALTDGIDPPSRYRA